MQGPLGIPSNQTAAFGRGVEKGGREVAPYLLDAYSMMLPASGLAQLMRGISMRRKGRATFEAGKKAWNLGKAKKSEALMLQEAARSGAPVKAGQIAATVESANRQFRNAKKMRSAAMQAHYKSQRKIRAGGKKLGSLGSAAKGASAVQDAERVKSYVEGREPAQTQDLAYVHQLRRYRGRR